MVIPLEGGKPCKNFRGKRQKIRSATLPSRREKKSWKTFEKDVLKQSKNCFLKNLKYDLQLIEKQVQSIEPGRGSQNF